MLTLYHPTSDSEGKVIRQIKAESGASTTNRKGGACPFPRLAGMGDIVGGAFGRQGWSGEPCPVVPPGPQYCRYWSLEASQGEACPWLGWRPAFRSWPLASWPLGLCGPSTHVGRVIGPLLLQFTLPPLLPLLKRKRKRERDSEKR